MVIVSVRVGMSGGVFSSSLNVIIVIGGGIEDSDRDDNDNISDMIKNSE